METHRDPYHYMEEVRMILHYPNADLHAVASTHVRDIETYKQLHAPLPVFQVRQMFSRAMVRFMEPVLVQPQWVNTVPHMMDMTEIEWKQQPLYQQVNTPVAEELIVEPATVAELLDRIRHMQAPEQAAIRARQRRNADVPQMHASIISFPRRA
jgi:hypothetical protein